MTRRVFASAWGPPRSVSTYSGVPALVFSRLASEGHLHAEFDQRPSGFDSLRWNRLSFRSWISEGRRARAVWRYLPRNIERLSKMMAGHPQLLDSDIVVQFGVGAMPPGGIPFLAHIEYPLATVFDNSVFSANYGFGRLSAREIELAMEGERIFADRCDLIWTNTPFTSMELQRTGVPAEKIRIAVPPGRPTSPRHGEGVGEGCRILFVGRNWQVKGGDQLVEAFAIVRRDYPDATLCLIGCDPPPAVRDIEGVDCLGLLSPEIPEQKKRLLEEYKRAAVFCTPSAIESTGMVFLEAAIAGLPVIMRRIQQTEALYPDHLFWKVDGDDPQRLADVICQVLGQPGSTRDRAAAAQAFVIETYGHEAFFRNLHGFISEACVARS